jgi:hypothetical protein
VASECFPKQNERFCVVIAWPYESGSVRMRRVLERHARHLEDTRPRQGAEMSAEIQPKCKMDLAPEELLRLIELILVCQIPGWTFLLGYILAKR